MGAYLPSEFPNMDSGDCFLPLREGVMFPDGCTLPGGVVPCIRVLPLKTSQTGVQHFWKRHVRLGGIGLPSILGF